MWPRPSVTAPCACPKSSCATRGWKTLRLAFWRCALGWINKAWGFSRSAGRRPVRIGKRWPSFSPALGRLRSASSIRLRSKPSGRTKTDKADAQRIAAFGAERRPAPWQARAAAAPRGAEGMRTQESNRLDVACTAVRKGMTPHLHWLDKEIEWIIPSLRDHIDHAFLRKALLYRSARVTRDRSDWGKPCRRRLAVAGKPPRLIIGAMMRKRVQYRLRRPQVRTYFRSRYAWRLTWITVSTLLGGGEEGKRSIYRCGSPVPRARPREFFGSEHGTPWVGGFVVTLRT